MPEEKPILKCENKREAVPVISPGPVISYFSITGFGSLLMKSELFFSLYVES